MACWAELPYDLIVHIANRIKVIEDFIAFGAVCTSWRNAATKDNFDVISPHVPLLMLGVAKHEDHYQEFYSLSKKKVSPIFLPKVRGSECVSIREGWLCNTEKDTGEIYLLHPFSRKKIHLPSRKSLLTFHGLSAFEKNHWGCIDLAVLSANPSVTSDYVLMVHHYGADSCLAFWRPGDLDWTHIDVINHAIGVAALVYNKGEFYSMSYSGRVRTYEVAGRNTTTTDQPIVKTRLVGEIDEYRFNPHVVEYYLVELSGALLLVSRYVKSTRDDPNGSYYTFKFKVNELDIMRGELKEEMKTLGDSSMFLGRNWASCIDDSKVTGIKPNHIYFADNWFNFSSNLDIGAYNLEDGKIKSFYPGPSPSSICPPAWVMPSLIK